MARVRHRSRVRSEQRAARPSAEERHPRRAPTGRYWLVAVALSAVVVYLNAPGHEFVLDDTRIIRDNIRIRSLANVPGLFASGYWDLQGPQALYRPFVLATYAINYALHGLSTYGYGIVNLALHAGVSFLLYAVVRSIGGSPFVAGITGILFAVHPVHTEAVTGMAGRPELLAALFFLLALLLHRNAPASGTRAMLFRAGTALSFACALLSKESAVTLLLVLPVLDALVPHANVTLRTRLLKDYLPLVGVAALYLAVRSSVLGGIVVPEHTIAPLDNPLVPVTTMPLGERLGASAGQAVMTAFAVVAEYARLLVWPLRLSPDYSYNQIPLVTSPLDARFLAGAALVAACAYGIVALWRRMPVAAFGLAFLALTYSIVSNFVVAIGTICAERLIYLPSAGVLMAAAMGAEWLAGTVPARRRLVYATLAIVITLAAARTWTRNDDWRDEMTLWSSAIVASPNSARVQSEYGRVLLNAAELEAAQGRTAEANRLFADAQKHFEAALDIFPSYALPMDGLATLHSLHQRYDEAAVLYERAVKVWPTNYGSLTNWGALLWQRSARSMADASALRAAGRQAEADALTRRAQDGFRDGMEKIDRALAVQPSYAQAHLIRAFLLVDYVGDRDGAIAEYEEVLRLMPDHPQRPAIEQELVRLRAAQSASPG